MGLFDLFKPAWMNKDERKALKAVKKLINNEILSNIAKNDKRIDIRMAAVGNLTDQVILTCIAKEDEHIWVREAAVKKLTNQVVLADFAKNGERDSVRIIAFKNLTDQQLIADVVKNGKGCNNYNECQMHQEAVKKLTDQIVLADIAKNARNNWVRIYAIQNLTEQVVLIDIAKNDKDGEIRIRAAEKLTDKSLAQRVFAGVVKDDKVHELYRGSAFEKITDQTILRAISNEPFVKEFIRKKAHIENLANIKKEKQKKIENCKNHEWEIHNGGDYAVHICRKCGAEKYI